MPQAACACVTTWNISKFFPKESNNYISAEFQRFYVKKKKNTILKSFRICENMKPGLGINDITIPDFIFSFFHPRHFLHKNRRGVQEKYTEKEEIKRTKPF